MNVVGLRVEHEVYGPGQIISNLLGQGLVAVLFEKEYYVKQEHDPQTYAPLEKPFLQWTNIIELNIGTLTVTSLR